MNGWKWCDMHRMSLQTEHYYLLKSGVKTVELRLLDDKRKLLNVGDSIEFSDASDSQDCFNARIIALHKHPTFDVLCDSVSGKQCGFETREDLLKVLEEFYPLSRQNDFGVVGIEIQKI